jgi:membrane fusion protein, heavy metal efflux system
MNKFLLVLLNTFVLSAQAESLSLNDQQLQKLNMQYVNPKVTQSLISQRFSAEVIIPPTQLRVLSAPRPGLVVQLYASPGDMVKQGQILARITSQELVSTQSEYLQTFTEKRLAETSFNRDKTLFQDGIIAQRRFLETQAHLENLTATLAEKRQLLKMSGMSDAQIGQIEQDKKLSAGLTIIAPIHGQIMEQQAQVGTKVDSASPLYTISQLSPLWIMVQVPIEQATKLKNGMLVRSSTLGVEGKIDAILRNLNKENQTVQVRAVIQKGSEQLTVGQVIDVDFAISSKAESMFEIPRQAIVRNENKTVVFINDQKIVRILPVKVMSEYDATAIVAGSLKSDMKIITNGTAALKSLWLEAGRQ